MEMISLGSVILHKELLSLKKWRTKTFPRFRTDIYTIRLMYGLFTGLFSPNGMSFIALLNENLMSR